MAPISAYPIPPVPGEWVNDGLCAQVDPNLWFPEQGESTKPGKAICKACPVINQCLQYALDNNIMHGTWGGIGERDRMALRHGRPLPTPAETGCGTRAGYGRHRREGEPICEACIDANAEYKREWRRKHLQERTTA